MKALQSASQKNFPLPKGFRPAANVRWATLLAETPSFVKRSTRNRAKRRGIRYEERVQAILEDTFKDRYIPGPWALFCEGNDPRPRYCQPDGLLLDFYRGRITIVEIKYNHCELAWWQLYKLYLPVVSKIFGTNWTYSCIEVVKWFDPHIRVPEPIQMQKDIEHAQEQIWSVNICNPSRL